MFTNLKPEDPKPEQHKQEQEDDDDEDVEKEVVGDWKIVNLKEIPVVTGEEDEQEIGKFRSKIYRFRNKEWKERGVGELRFLKHKFNHLIRVLNRAEKTLKVTVNHLPVKYDVLGILEKLKTSNNTWTWAAQDISDDTPIVEKFCAKFTSKDDFEKFEKLFNQACETNGKVFAQRKEKKEKEEKVEEKVVEKVEEKSQ